ncbi:MAG: signal peptidase I [Kiritimatiellaeota bacterium]|nr:signal peptidase I [Kiritimatiellota bacterium]
MFILTYLKNRSLRKHIKEIIKQAAHISHVNDDIFTETTKNNLRTIREDAEKVDIDDPNAMREFLSGASRRFAETLPKKNHPVLREYADILAVALTVAFGLRALYLQPFKIPTSSMQPTLFGIHFIKDVELPDGSNILPHLPQPLHYALFSTRDAFATVKRDGRIAPSSVFEYTKNVIFTNTSFKIGGIGYDLPGQFKHVFTYCGMQSKVDTEEMKAEGYPLWWVDSSNQSGGSNHIKLKYMNGIFREGDSLCKGWLSLGDHLFVDRVSYHFREPARGDIVVFITENIPTGTKGYFYIKRLIGLPGDTLKVVDDKVYVKTAKAREFRPITDFGIEGLNRVYSSKGGYHGHLGTNRLAPGREIRVPENKYFMMGDNSANSHDGRSWNFDPYESVEELERSAFVPRENIIGRAFFIFWPFSRRWGFADTTPPLDYETRRENSFLPSMQLQ